MDNMLSSEQTARKISPKIKVKGKDIGSCAAYCKFQYDR